MYTSIRNLNTSTSPTPPTTIDPTYVILNALSIDEDNGSIDVMHHKWFFSSLINGHEYRMTRCIFWNFNLRIHSQEITENKPEEWNIYSQLSVVK